MVKDKKTITFLQLFYYICYKDCDVFSQSDVGGNFSAELQIMEQYYFIQQNGVKKGPFKLNELKSENIYFDELVWRSDDDKWKKANEFEELENIYVIKPPLTPIEIKKNDINKEFLQKILPNTLGIYFIVFLLISLSSFIIASNSWDEVKKSYIINKDEVGKNSFEIENNNLKFNEDKIADEANYLKKLRGELKIAESELESKRKQKKSHKEIMISSDKRDDIQYLINTTEFDSTYLSSVISYNKSEQIYGSNTTQTVIQPIYKVPENIIALENINGLQQPFLFRPFYAYFSKIYLTREEQNSYGILFKNLALGTFLFLTILLIITLVIRYIIKISNIK
jgi:hypothetical protein